MSLSCGFCFVKEWSLSGHCLSPESGVVISGWELTSFLNSLDFPTD